MKSDFSQGPNKNGIFMKCLDSIYARNHKSTRKMTSNSNHGCPTSQKNNISWNKLNNSNNMAGPSKKSVQSAVKMSTPKTGNLKSLFTDFGHSLKTIHESKHDYGDATSQVYS